MGCLFHEIEVNKNDAIGSKFIDYRHSMKLWNKSKCFTNERGVHHMVNPTARLIKNYPMIFSRTRYLLSVIMLKFMFHLLKG